MAFKLGHSKYGGRKKGTPNKRSNILRERLDDAGFDPIQNLIEIYPELEAKQKAQVCLELLSFIHPKLKAIDHTAQVIESSMEAEKEALAGKLYDLAKEQARQEYIQESSGLRLKGQSKKA